MPRYLLLLREGLNLASSHPLNVLVDQFASRSTVYIIALVVSFVNNVLIVLVINRGRKKLIFVKTRLTNA